MKHLNKKSAILFPLLILTLIQLHPVDRSNPPVRADIMAPLRIASLLRRACYDCHSNETNWPWYSYAAPASWLVAADVTDGRDRMNFSAWREDNSDDQKGNAHDILKTLKKGEMPPSGYILMHPEAQLTQPETKELLVWFKDFMPSVSPASISVVALK